MARTRARHRVESSSGNVFSDLHFKNADELDTKVRLAIEIVSAIEGRPLSQVEAAALLGIGQPKVSALKSFKLDGFSVERLMTFLTLLGRDVEIRVAARPRRKGAGRIFVARVPVAQGSRAVAARSAHR